MINYVDRFQKSLFFNSPNVTNLSIDYGGMYVQFSFSKI